MVQFAPSVSNEDGEYQGKNVTSSEVRSWLCYLLIVISI